MTDTQHDGNVQFLRHAVATLAYRAAKTMRGAPASFGEFRVGPQSRTPAQILAHIGDLMAWAVSLARGEEKWTVADPLPWTEEVERFFRLLTELDQALQAAQFAAKPEQLFQGPVADALTHVGQLNMLRRLAGSPVRGENYAVAGIAIGHTGPMQAAASFEFD